MGALKEPAATLYEQDFHAWAAEQALALARRDWSTLDVPNLVEEVESMGRQQRAELRNRLVQLLVHLAMWREQAGRRARHERSWRLTIVEQRIQLRQHLSKNPSLKPHIAEAMHDAWEIARVIAARESNVSLERFPEACPFDWDQAMQEGRTPD